MRIARSRAVPAAVRLAQNEALAAFSNGAVYVEKYIEHPPTSRSRSWGTHGAVRHLGERDCSVQRRHQKLVEESPSPALDTGPPRQRWAQAAVSLASNIATWGGTLEFLLDTRRLVLLHGNEHPHPGRAPGHGNGDELRPGQGADPGGRGRADQLPG
jgi:acetyl-CoA carboxylase biotin carboxylase subunit